MLKTLDNAGLPDIARWAAELTDAEEWSHGLVMPFDDAPAFDQTADPSDKAFVRSSTRRLLRDYRADPEAFRHLDPMPKAGQSLHGVISGKYALWQLVPALIERTKQKIADLHIATLSYSRQNAAEMLDLLDSGHIKRVTLLVSYFFKAQNREIYDALVPELLARGHRVLSMRTHAKICLFRMTSNTRYVVEASANLRSCKNIEQFTLTRCPKLYRFHRTWIEDELLKPRKREKADAQ